VRPGWHGCGSEARKAGMTTRPRRTIWLLERTTVRVGTMDDGVRG
jgi:hypothetical protein